MSAKGRKTKKKDELALGDSEERRTKEKEAAEFYPTPSSAILPLLETDLVRLPGGRWIEPCAGTGRIIRTVNEFRADVSWIMCELQEQFDQFLRPLIRATHEDALLPFGDFVHREWDLPMADVLIMNPPFSLTMQFIAAAMTRAHWVVCLQRANWFGSQARAPWLIRHCPDAYTLPERSSFRPDGQTDNCEYTWFVWPPGDRRRREGRYAMLTPTNGGQGSLF